MSDEMSIHDQFNACQSLYEEQKKRTKRASQRANAELQRLIGAVKIPEDIVRNAKSGSSPNVIMPEDAKEQADMKKLLFINTQVSVVTAILETLLAQDQAWDTADFVCPPTEEQMTTRIGHYQSARRLLEAIQQSFEDAAGIDSSLFAPVWKASMSFLNTHWKALTGAAVAGGAVGALAGAGAVKLHIGFQSFMVAHCGAAWASAGGFVAGGLAGLVIAGVVIGLMALHQRWNRSQQEKDAEELSKIKGQIAKISQQPQLTADNLSELENLFTEAFHKPVQLATGRRCPICFEHFCADGGNRQEYAVKAPRCVCNCMVHSRCWRNWQLQCGNDNCIMCRQ